MSFDFIGKTRPRTVSYGVKDNTKRTLPVVESTLPQGIPLIYLFAEKGSTVSKAYGGVNSEIQFGSQTFDSLSKFYHHPTKLRNLLVQKASATCVYRRLIPKDAGVKANVTLWADVLETSIPNYKRNSDGTYRLTDGLKELDSEKPYIQGTLIKWYSTSATSDFDYGTQKPQDGSMCRWKFYENDENVAHVLCSDIDFNTTTTGHAKYAGKRVYNYPRLWDMFQPEVGYSVRVIYDVNEDGIASKINEEVFGYDEDYVVRSKIYPIVEAKAAFEGSYYNRLAFSIAPSGTKIDSKYIKALKAIPYSFTRYVRKDNNVTASIYPTLAGTNEAEFTFVEKGVSPISSNDFSFETVINETTWDKEGYEEIEYVNFYRENFDNIIRRVAEIEKDYVNLDDKEWADGYIANTSGWFDYTDVSEDIIMEEFRVIDPFTCKSMNGVEYFTLRTDFNKPEKSLPGFQEENMTANIPIYFKNGNDGTTSIEMLEELIKEDLENYENENHHYMNIFVNPENLFFDTGFSIDLKKKVKKYISLKKNTIAFFTHHTADMGRADYSVEEIDSIVKSLSAELKLAPESDYYGTNTCRAMILVGTGDETKNGVRYPLIYDLAVKILKFMGASDRRWITNERPDIPENHNVELLKHVKPTFIPPSIQDSLWSSGVTYVEPGDNCYFYPALKTIYDDDTSALNSLVNILPIPYLERVACETWKECVGKAGESNAVFINKVERVASRKLINAFGGIVTVSPYCIIDEFDNQTGYTWHLEFHVSAYTMKTIQIVSTIYQTPIESK